MNYYEQLAKLLNKKVIEHKSFCLAADTYCYMYFIAKKTQ